MSIAKLALATVGTICAAGGFREFRKLRRGDYGTLDLTFQNTRQDVYQFDRQKSWFQDTVELHKGKRSDYHYHEWMYCGLPGYTSMGTTTTYTSFKPIRVSVQPYAGSDQLDRELMATVDRTQASFTTENWEERDLKMKAALQAVLDDKRSN